MKVGTRMLLITSTDVVVDGLSFSEKIATHTLLKKLLRYEKRKGIINVNDVVSESNEAFTRTVAVNVLRKLEITGVLRTRSLGVKGTYFEILHFEATKEICKKIGLVKR